MDNVESSLVNFTETELRFILTAVSNYLNHDEVKDLIVHINNKIRNFYTIDGIYRGYKHSVGKLNNPDIKIALLSREDIPVFKFIECPSTLKLNEIYPPSYSWTSDYFDWNNGSLWIKDRYNARVCINKYEIELLLAFIIYHKLKDRGIKNSGLKPENEEKS